MKSENSDLFGIFPKGEKKKWPIVSSPRWNVRWAYKRKGEYKTKLINNV